MKNRVAMLVIAMFGFSLAVFSQSDERPNTIELAYGAHDSYGPFKNVNFPLGIANTDNLEPIYQIAYFRKLNDFVDIGAAVTGSGVDNMFDGDDFTNTAASIGSEAYRQLDAGSHANLDLLLRYNWWNGIDFSKNAWIKSYLWTGAGVNYVSELESVTNHDHGWTFDVPFGIGLKGGSDKVNLAVQTGMKFGLFDKMPNMWAHTARLGFNFGPPKKVTEEVVDVPPPPPPPPSDRDGDGIIDSSDDCPDEAGVRAYNGCPPPADSDGDGIADAEDDCPNEAGTAAYNGCPPPPPPPDSDGDGIIDADDDCPEVAGTAAYNGCPPPPPPADRDGDGVPDSADRCPDRPGPSTNNGCPVVKEETKKRLEEIARNIQFETNSDALKTESRNILDEVVSIMASNPAYNLSVEGHTDSVGAEAYNQTLSEKRARSVVRYLTSKGVSSSRMTSAGFGESRPIADNNTASGRALNRRVELHLRLR